MKVYQDINKNVPDILPYSGSTGEEKSIFDTFDMTSDSVGLYEYAAVFYCPYIPLTVSGVKINEFTLENTETITFKTRFGYDE